MLVARIACLASVVIAAALGADDVESLKQRVAELERENAELKRTSVTFSALNRAGLHVWMTGAEALDANGPSAPVCQLLAFDEEERKAVAKAFAHAKQSLGEVLRAQGLKPTITGGSMTLAVEDFSAAGAPIEERLDQELAAAVGGDRRDFLKTLASNAIENSFLQFGRGRLEFTLKPADHGRFDYQFSWKSARGSSSSSASSEGLPREAALLAPYIPKSFGGQRADAGDAAPADGAKPNGKADF